MSRFSKRVGDLSIEVQQPSPRWTRVCYRRSGDDVIIGGLGEQELRDLQYLVNSAVAFVDAQEDEAKLRRLESCQK